MISQLGSILIGFLLLFLSLLLIYICLPAILSFAFPLYILIFSLLAFSIALSLYLILRGLYCLSTLFYEITFLNTATRGLRTFGNYHWWDEIIDNVFLSAQPQKNKKHYQKMLETAKGHPISILTLLKEHETTGIGILNEAYTPADWQQFGVDQCVITTQDFKPLAPESFAEGVEFLHKEVLSGKAVFVHCKAGRGRSASMVVAYLLKYHPERFGKKSAKENVDDAIAFVKEKRPVLSIREAQKQSIMDWYMDLGVLNM